MASRMGKRHKHLAAAPGPFPDIIPDRRIAALEPACIAEPFETRLAVCRCLRFRLKSSESR